MEWQVVTLTIRKFFRVRKALFTSGVGQQWCVGTMLRAARRVAGSPKGADNCSLGQNEAFGWIQRLQKQDGRHGEDAISDVSKSRSTSLNPKVSWFHPPADSGIGGFFQLGWYSVRAQKWIREQNFRYWKRFIGGHRVLAGRDHAGRVKLDYAVSLVVEGRHGGDSFECC